MVCVDDALACSHDSKAVMVGIPAKFEIKNEDINEPKRYLGVNVDKFQLPNGKYAWRITSNSYLQGAIDTAQRLISEDGRTLKNVKRPHKGPLPHGYKP